MTPLLHDGKRADVLQKKLHYAISPKMRTAFRKILTILDFRKK